MKVRLLLLCAISLFVYDQHANDDQILKVQSTRQQKKMNMLLGVIGKQDDTIRNIVHVIEECLSCKHQKKTGFNITTKQFDTLRSKKEIKQLFEQGYPLVVFLNTTENNNIEWRIYDATRAEMVKGTRLKLAHHNKRDIGFAIADALWKELTGKESCFATRIAFCRQAEHKGKSSMRHVYVAHPFSPSIKESKLVSTSSVKFAPRWMVGAQKPKIFFSEYTPINVRLSYAQMNGETNVAVNFDGLNMMPSFSDGNHVVLCSSCEGSSQLYYGVQKNGTWEFKRLTEKITNNKGNNISPTLCENGDVIFCSDFKTRRPQIYHYKADKKELVRITNNGFCTNPTYSKERNTIAYSKLLSGKMQIFLYHLDTNKHEQITNDQGSKDDCSWSPCGTYLSFSYSHGREKRIGVLNVDTKERFFVTPAHEYCAYPSWSPIYTNFVV